LISLFSMLGSHLFSFEAALGSFGTFCRHRCCFVLLVHIAVVLRRTFTGLLLLTIRGRLSI
jgi:hypothetical protein